MFRGRTKWFVIAWAALAATFACVFVPFNIPRIVNILRHEGSVIGKVTAPDCENHNSARYSFEFDGKAYAGIFPVDGSCQDLKVGSPIAVYFSKVSPEENQLREPAADLWNESISIALVCLIFPTLILWRLTKSNSRSAKNVRTSTDPGP
jgi:hypothetical protein